MTANNTTVASFTIRGATTGVSPSGAGATLANNILDNNVTGKQFNDVLMGRFGYGFINRVGELGVTAGCGAGNYCPASPVTRGQMAVFLVRAFGL